jgi:hypothetical protein
MEPREDVRGQDSSSQDRLDQWLDAALHEYGSAEARTGLEGRVLANLAVERARRGTRQRGWFTELSRRWLVQRSRCGWEK